MGETQRRKEGKRSRAEIPNTSHAVGWRQKASKSLNSLAQYSVPLANLL